MKSLQASTLRGCPGGFTLIEIVVVVAIIGILSTIAYPSYLAYRVKANRAAAQSFLIQLASRQQQYFLDARSYASTLSSLGYGAVPGNVASYYRVEEPINVANTATPPTFLLTASPLATTMQASDGVLTISSSGVRARGSESW